ncbi:MAG: xylulokinase [Actinomycetaceae bacterium]
MNETPGDGPLVLAVDTSTTSTKAVVVDAAGRTIVTARREIELITPAMGFYEHDATQWWTTVDEAVGEAVGSLSSVDRERVAAMCVTHQRESFVPVDAAGKPLRTGILWLDSRADDQIERLGTDEIHALSGKPPGVTPALYKMTWVKENEPGMLEGAHKVVDVHAYVVFHLTGEWVDSVACADSLGLFDISRQDWDDGLLELAGVTRDQMTTLVKPGEILGEVRASVAQSWGLPGAIPLVAGAGDGQAAGLGAAAVDPDTAYLNLGTAVNAGVHGAEYAYGPVYRTLAAGLPDEYDFEVLQSSGSYLAGWFRQSLGDPARRGAPDPELDRAAEQVPLGCGGLVTLPYWNAVQSPHWDAIARGAIVGWRGSHGRANMYRSILEAIGMEMRRNLKSLEEATGTPITTVRAMGGGTRSTLWRQIMTDCLGLPVTACVEEEVTALGAAVLAQSVTGAHGDTPDVRASAKAMARFGDVTEPDLENHERYEELGQIQGKLYDQLKGVTRELHEFSEKYPANLAEN